MDWLLRLLYLGDPAAGLSAAWPPRLPTLETTTGAVLLPLLTLLALAGVWWAYRKEPGYLALKRRRTLALLRSGAVLVLAFVCTGAYLELRRTEEHRATVALLVDRSASMAITDPRSTPEERHEAERIFGTATGAAVVAQQPRSAWVGQVLDDPDGLYRRLQRRFEVVSFAVGAQPGAAPLDTGSATSAGVPAGPSDGEATQLGAALRDVAARLRGRALAGAVLLSDGGWNRGEDPVAVARELHLPVHALGVGLPQVRDVAVPFLIADDVVFKGDVFPLAVRIVQHGCEGRTLRLLIRRDGEVVKEESLVLDARGEFTQVVEIPADRAGAFRWSAEAVPFDDEVTAANNRAERDGPRVIDGRIRTLLVEDSPRWDYRFLRAALEADRKRFDVRSVLRQADPELLRQPGSGLLPRLPGSPQEWRPWHLVVLGDVPPSLLTRAEVEALAGWVREDGGALVVVAGPKAMPGAWAGTPLAELLPVEMPALRPPPETPESESARPVTAEFRPRLTDEGRRAVALRQGPDELLSAAAWERVSTMRWFFRCGRLKPGASAWLVHPSELVRSGASAEPLPLMAVQHYGRGQVLWIGSDESWRWRHQPGPAFHRRFWGNLATSLSMNALLGSSGRVQLEADRQTYAVGDEARLTARVLDADFRPSSAERVELTAERDALDRGAVELRAIPGRPGWFQGAYRLAGAGIHRLHLSGDDGPTATELRLTATTPQLETADPALKEDLLRAVAAAGDGSYHRLADWQQACERLLALPPVTEVRREERTLWNAPGIIALFVLLLGLEWFLRKRSDLL